MVCRGAFYTVLTVLSRQVQRRRRWHHIVFFQPASSISSSTTKGKRPSVVRIRRGAVRLPQILQQTLIAQLPAILLNFSVDYSWLPYVKPQNPRTTACCRWWLRCRGRWQQWKRPYVTSRGKRSGQWLQWDSSETPQGEGRCPETLMYSIKKQLSSSVCPCTTSTLWTTRQGRSSGHALREVLKQDVIPTSCNT